MCINCLKFIGIKEIIIATATHGANPFQLIVIFENSHKTGNISFHRCFIYYTCVSDSTLWRTGNVISHHYGNRSPTSNALGNTLACKITLYLRFRLVSLTGDKTNQILLCPKCRNTLGNTDACCHDTCQNTCLFHSHILPPFLQAEKIFRFPSLLYRFTRHF